MTTKTGPKISSLREMLAEAEGNTYYGCIRIAPHVGSGLNDGGSDKIAVGITADLEPAAIEMNCSTLLLRRCYQACHSLFSRGRDERSTVKCMRSLRVISGINTQVRALFKTSIHSQLLCSLDEFGKPSLGLSNKNSCDYVKAGK